MSAAKPTPAMREWCRKLVNPKWCTLVRSGSGSFSTRGTLSCGKPNWPMVDRLENSGLITWKKTPDPLWPERQIETAELTDAGKALAA